MTLFWELLKKDLFLLNSQKKILSFNIKNSRKYGCFFMLFSLLSFSFIETKYIWYHIFVFILMYLSKNFVKLLLSDTLLTISLNTNICWFILIQNLNCIDCFGCWIKIPSQRAIKERYRKSIFYSLLLFHPVWKKYIWVSSRRWE